MGEALGATVTAVVSRPEAADEAVRRGADDVLVIARDAVGPVPAGAYDAVIETVAGPAFRSSVEALTDNGTLCLVGAVGGGHVDFDAWQLIRPVRLTGYSTETLTGADLAHTLKALVDWLQMQALAVPPYRLMPLAQADQAHALLEQGNIRERLLLVP
jgi:NADPH2:quinone reductase